MRVRFSTVARARAVRNCRTHNTNSKKARLSAHMAAGWRDLFARTQVPECHQVFVPSHVDVPHTMPSCNSRMAG